MVNTKMLLPGYKFLDLEAIKPYLEPSAAGITTTWAKTVAKRLGCIVTVGYPEIAVSEILPSEHATHDPRVNNFNSTVTVAANGEVLAHYRKSFLFSTDETWASEGSGFYSGNLPLRLSKAATGISKVAMGICMDVNPYKFEAPFYKCEFATHAVECKAELVILSMAWSSLELTPENIQTHASKPDLLTLSYWVSRFNPLQLHDVAMPVILVLGNRCGSENDTTYAGTSTVMRMAGNEIHIWAVLGRGEERCLVVDTDKVSCSTQSERPSTNSTGT